MAMGACSAMPCFRLQLHSVAGFVGMPGGSDRMYRQAVQRTSQYMQYTRGKWAVVSR